MAIAAVVVRGLFAAGVLSLVSACSGGERRAPERGPAPVAPAPQAAPQAQPDPQPPKGPGDLPEDPEAGKRSEQQWREHLDHEELERQQLFDRQRLPLHKKLVRSIQLLRARYDRAASDGALAALEREAPQRTEALRALVTEIDHWGVNSRVLPDYQALIGSLEEPYLRARRKALHGDKDEWSRVTTDFNHRLQTINGWLKEVAESEDEERAEAAEHRPKAAEHPVSEH